jgi:hypothetical protein
MGVVAGGWEFQAGQFGARPYLEKSRKAKLKA